MTKQKTIPFNCPQSNQVVQCTATEMMRMMLTDLRKQGRDINHSGLVSQAQKGKHG
ncbi:hypothetical protein YOLOSWAG_229 [Erwinia phage vB_EamM_Yoloswag]|uniref:Uncharacterized protein n=1 Tax=Erwinia phage vB_EamM_Yoloswag TaxID=1958956 RepID=A0A1S6L3F4_9CAUD|nr:hypothetical protein HOR66_gp229 [Erwinia phage vB_EamM_Yoloswag]AQT28707.1 hypothetical protein YOLOSWAG_229 [Erwinia phage vB_EamM_Yoloswag]